MKITRLILSSDEKVNFKIPATPMAKNGWSVWECGPSRFDWSYDAEEHAYLYAGKVDIKTPDETIQIKAGDYVIFPKGLSCSWNVLEQVVKVYRFC